MKTLKRFAVGGLAILSLLSSGCENSQRFDDLVKISVNSEDRLWVIKNQKDADGDRLVTDVSWKDLLYNAYEANGVDNAKDLSVVIRDRGYVMLPRENVNPSYDLR